MDYTAASHRRVDRSPGTPMELLALPFFPGYPMEQQGQALFQSLLAKTFGSILIIGAPIPFSPFSLITLALNLTQDVR
jgi:hypothetical protein